MKKLITIGLLGLLVVQITSRTWILISFKFNQDFIATYYCIEKEVENNTCKGVCQLKERLQKATPQEQEQPAEGAKRPIELNYFSSSMLIIGVERSIQLLDDQVMLFASIDCKAPHLTPLFRP
ncbi:MAG: hypothetical protein AAF734_06640, partial [Bacteroidota bacterium]